MDRAICTACDDRNADVSCTLGVANSPSAVRLRCDGPVAGNCLSRKGRTLDADWLAECGARGTVLRLLPKVVNMAISEPRPFLFAFPLTGKFACVKVRASPPPMGSGMDGHSAD